MKGLFNFLAGLLVVAFVAAALIVFGAHPDWLAPVSGFFADYSAEEVISTLVVAVIFLWPDAGVAFINVIKNTLQLEGDEAHKAVLVILTFFSAIVLLVTGAFGGEVTFGSLVYYLGEAYLLSQYTYKRLNPGPVSDPN